MKYIHLGGQPSPLIPKLFHLPKWNPVPIKQSLRILPSPLPLATTNLLAGSMELLILEISYKFISYGMWPFMSGIFHLVCFQSSFIYCNIITIRTS